MSDNSSIEWTDATWNVVTGCTKVSPGCDNCYAETFAERWRGTPGHHFEAGFDLTLRPERMDLPLKWRKPKRIFVNSMSDLFHEGVPDEFIAKVWTVMAATPQHTYQILTKRHGRMRSIVRRIAWRTPTTEERRRGVHGSQAYIQSNEDLNFHLGAPHVLPNVWLGVSVEDQKRADLRIPALLDTPATVRWISAEPLLGPVDLARHGWRGLLDWVVTGGESGRGARPMHPQWARDLRDQCTAAGVPFLFKQFGAWVPESAWLHPGNAPAAFLDLDGTFRPLVNGKPTSPPMARGDAITIRRVSKKAAGRELDGQTWDEFPATSPAVA